MDRGIKRAVCGIVEACRNDGVARKVYGRIIDETALRQANEYSCDKKMRDDLICSLKLNMINCREYPFSLLSGKYCLALSHRKFKSERAKFQTELAREFGLM